MADKALDRKQFMDVVSAGSVTEVLKRHPTRRKKYARKDDPRPKMVEACFFFFSALEDFFIGRPDEIEHIMPRKWRDHWPLMSGQVGLDLIDNPVSSSRKDDDPVVIDTLNRNQVVQRLGNLTILSEALNIKQGNLGWNEKKPKLLAHSLLPINLQLQSETVWDENRIAVRSQELFQHAKEIWQR